MFTGIIEATGRVSRVEPRGGGTRVTLETARPLRALALGESIAVNGACLTVVAMKDRRFTVEVSPETLRRTTLATLAAGTRVNLERSLRADGRLGGHFVLGHVDGVGIVDDLRAEGGSHWLTVGYPPSLAALFIRKGSVAVDGVSLTVAGLDERHFDVQVIPYTLAVTTLGTLRPGDRVNVEADVLLKQIAAMLRSRRPGRVRARQVG